MKTRMQTLGVMVALLSVAMLVACGDQTPPPTPTPPPPTATPPPVEPTRPTTDELTLIREAITRTTQLQSYHYTLSIDATDPTQRAQGEGDYVAPDKGYIKGRVGDQDVEQIIIGDAAYVKDANGNWTPRETRVGRPPTTLVDADNFLTEPNPVGNLQQIMGAADNLRDAGEDQVNGVATRHFTFDISTEKMVGEAALASVKELIGDLPLAGTGEIWVDPNTGYVHRASANLDLSVVVRLADAITYAYLGTPTPGGPTPTPVPPANFDVDMTLSRHNDPAITIPDPRSGTPTP